MELAFSIIIPAYNVEEYIHAPLDSVLTQLGDSGEIIVVDDGSTDGTLDIVTGLLKGVTAARIITGPNGGASVARNKGIRAARGKYLHFLDSDDWLLPGAISSLMERAAQTDADIIFSNVRVLWERTGRIQKKIVCQSSIEGTVSEVFPRLPRTPIHGRAFKKSFLEARNIYFPEGMLREDFVFNHNTLAFAEKVATLKKYTYVYRKRGGDNVSLSQQTLTERGLRDRFRQIEMTQDPALFAPLQLRLPKVNLEKTDFSYRLMTHHLAYMPHAERATQERAISQFVEFLQKHWQVVERSVPKATLEIYKAMIRGEVDSVISLLNSHAKVVQLTGRNKKLGKSQLKLEAGNEKLSAEVSKAKKKTEALLSRERKHLEMIAELQKQLLHFKSKLKDINEAPVRHIAAAMYRRLKRGRAATRSPAK